MLPKLIIVGVFIIVGVIVYFIVRAIMNRGRPPRTTATPPIDIVDRAPNPSSSHKYETPDERIARIEEELRRLDDEGDTPPKSGS